MNTYDNDTKFCNDSDKTSIPNDPNTIKEVIQENSNLIYGIAVNIDRLQHNLFGVGGSLDHVYTMRCLLRTQSLSPSSR